MTAIEGERIVKPIETLARGLIAAIGQGCGAIAAGSRSVRRNRGIHHRVGFERMLDKLHATNMVDGRCCGALCSAKK
jgi:hypothetical protein